MIMNPDILEITLRNIWSERGEENKVLSNQ